MLVAIQPTYPDLYAVLKFVPKKNGLNPALAKVQKGDSEATRIDKLRPRDVKRRLEDLGRTVEQSWLLVCCYLTIERPEASMRPLERIALLTLPQPLSKMRAS